MSMYHFGSNLSFTCEELVYLAYQTSQKDLCHRVSVTPRVLQETSPGFRMVRCACFSNSAIRKLPPPMFPVLWYNLAASALAQACKMLCTKNSLIHWPLVLTKLRSQPTAPFFSACFPSALIHIAFIVALHNSRCVHTHVFLLLMD